MEKTETYIWLVKVYNKRVHNYGKLGFIFSGPKIKTL